MTIQTMKNKILRNGLLSSKEFDNFSRNRIIEQYTSENLEELILIHCVHIAPSQFSNLVEFDFYYDETMDKIIQVFRG